MKYIVTYWKGRELNSWLLEFSEVAENCDVLRTIRFYENKVTVATEEGGFLGEWYENPNMSNIYKSSLEFIEDLKNNPEFILVESNKEEFEKQWLKATSQPGFYLKPYSEYTEEDYIK